MINKTKKINKKKMSTIIDLTSPGIQELRAFLSNGIKHQVGDYVPDPTALKTFVWQGDGIYCVRETDLGRFTYKVSDVNTPKLVTTLKEGFENYLPKMPMSIYNNIVGFFKEFYQKHKTEVYLRMYYNRLSDEFKYVILKQKLTATKADWEFNDPAEYGLGIDDILVMQVHSHHTMSGSFSTIDDADHQTLEGVHMVIGKIFDDVPQYEIRFSVGNKKVKVSLDQIFDVPSYNYDLSLFGNWEERCIPEQSFPSRSLFQEDGSLFQEDDDYGLSDGPANGHLSWRDSIHKVYNLEKPDEKDKMILKSIEGGKFARASLASI